MQKPYTVTIDEDVMDIPTLHATGVNGYHEYVMQYLLFVDHHDVLRATQGEYPLATSPEQVDVLISILNEVKARMVEAGS